MNKKLMAIGVVVMVAVMAFGVIGTAAAQGQGRGPRGPQGDQAGGLLGGLEFQFGPRGEFRQTLMDAVTQATGLTAREVLSELRDGKTLTDILTENGADPQTVSDAVKAQLTDEINQALADGDITQERADDLLGRLDTALETAMTTSLEDFPLRERARVRLDETLVGVLAEMAGVDVQDILDEVTTPSLAEIAQSHGLDPDAIISETETRITDEINQAVADGEITQEQADAALDGLHDRLVDRFNASFHPFRQRDGMRGLVGTGV